MLALEERFMIREMYRKGISISEIARRTGRDRKTIRQVVNAPELAPARHPRQAKVCKIDPYAPYLERRMAEGVFNARIMRDKLRKVNPRKDAVTYPLLRVEIEEVKIERVRGFPPRLLRPASIEPFDLEIDGHLCPSETAKATHLAKLAPQLPVGALQQRGGADEFACHPIQGIVGDGLLKIALQRRHGFRGSRSPLLGKGRQPSSRFFRTLRLIHGAGLLHQLLPRFLVAPPL